MEQIIYDDVLGETTLPKSKYTNNSVIKQMSITKFITQVKIIRGHSLIDLQDTINSWIQERELIYINYNKYIINSIKINQIKSSLKWYAIIEYEMPLHMLGKSFTFKLNKGVLTAYEN